jgi:hypothetical protein
MFGASRSGPPNKNDIGMYIFTVEVLTKTQHLKNERATQETATKTLSITISWWAPACLHFPVSPIDRFPITRHGTLQAAGGFSVK